jgi:hypothetical protein
VPNPDLLKALLNLKRTTCRTNARVICLGARVRASFDMQDEKIETLRDDINNVDLEAQRHEGRIATGEQRVADLGQQIADMPEAPQVPPSHLSAVDMPIKSWLLAHVQQQEHGLA